MTTLATPDQLSIYLGRGPLPRGVDGLDQAEVEQWTLLLELVSGDVVQACGRDIAAGTGTVKLAGTHSRDLLLPQAPVTSVTSVAVNGVALGSGEWTWNERGTLRRGSASWDPDDAGALDGFTWGGPTSTVEVTYAWGFETIPTWAKAATLRACARIIGNPGQVTQETLGVYSATYGDRTKDGSHITDAERKYLRRCAGVPSAGTFRQEGLG